MLDGYDNIVGHGRADGEECQDFGGQIGAIGRVGEDPVKAVLVTEAAHHSAHVAELNGARRLDLEGGDVVAQTADRGARIIDEESVSRTA